MASQKKSPGPVAKKQGRKTFSNTSSSENTGVQNRYKQELSRYRAQILKYQEGETPKAA
jgi:hypothetical protein